jgi:hypothetical protein
VEFYDAVTPANIPAGAYACLYYDGLYKASPEQARRFKATRWITVEGGAAAAAGAGCADFEAGNPVHDVSGRLTEWASERQAMKCRARVYCNRSDLPRALDAAGDLSCVSFWIATLDNKQWSAPELVADILALGVTLAEDRLWAVQYAGGMTAKFDTSLLYGTW